MYHDKIWVHVIDLYVKNCSTRNENIVHPFPIRLDKSFLPWENMLHTLTPICNSMSQVGKNELGFVSFLQQKKIVGWSKLHFMPSDTNFQSFCEQKRMENPLAKLKAIKIINYINRILNCSAIGERSLINLWKVSISTTMKILP